MRIVYSDSDGLIAICFHILISTPEAILMFDFIKGNYPKVGIAEAYYQSLAGEIFMGKDAGIAYEQDKESEFINNQEVSSGTIDYKPEFPVIHILKYAMFEATHPEALVSYKEFIERKIM